MRLRRGPARGRIEASSETLQLCAALDRLGAVAPWREYMTAYVHESEDDNTAYGEESDREVWLAWMRGRLRLAADVDQSLPAGADARQEEFNVAGPIDWERAAEFAEHHALSPGDVVDVCSGHPRDAGPRLVDRTP